MGMIHHFTELNAYRKSCDLAGRIFTVSKRWPAEERFALTDPIRRASRSVGASLAESWGKRRYEAHFVSKLTDADAGNHEVEHWLLSAHGAGYLNEREMEELVSSKREVGRLLGTMILTPGLFLLHERRPHSALQRVPTVGGGRDAEDGGRLF
jgi:four helix bundle protein